MEGRLGAVYRIAAIDLDGTLLHSSGVISEANAEALQGLLARGVVVCAATARPYFGVARLFRRLGIEPAAIASGGAEVRLQDGSLVTRRVLPTAFAPFLADLCDRAGWRGTLTTLERSYWRDSELPAWAGSRSDIVAVTRLADTDLTGLLAAVVHVPAGDALLEELEGWAGQVAVYDALSSRGERLVTVTAAGVTKGSGLIELCRALGANASEVVAFGDSDVDLPMFAVAGLAVAMGNASGAVQAAAAMVTSPADDDGFAEAVRRIWV